MSNYNSSYTGAQIDEAVGRASSHASRHASGGADAITPASIGAMASDATPAPAAHAGSHASGGADVITPASIGASVPGAELTVTLPATAADYTADETDGYTVSVSVQGLALTGYAYVVSPVPASRAAYGELNAYMLEPVTANVAVFHVDDVPTTALTVKVLKVQVSA